MDAEQYLKSILQKYRVQSQDINVMKKDRKNIEEYLDRYFSKDKKQIYYAGSYEKGTAINIKYDLDLVIYFRKNAFASPYEMYRAVYDKLNQQYEIKQNNAAIRVKIKGKEIDVVPALVERNNWAHLYKSDTGQEVKTNVLMHLHNVENSGCVDVIRLMKIWKHQHNLDISSFMLELLTIQALKGFGVKKLEPRFQHVLEYIQKEIQFITIVDPANPQNVVSEKLSWLGRQNIYMAAMKSVHAGSWSEVVQ